MILTGGCFCGILRFAIDGEVKLRALCLCKTCQKFSGGGGNFFLGIEAIHFRYTQGQPHRFTEPDEPDASTREFCGECGVHIAARSPKAPGGLIVKVGTLDDPSDFGTPQIVCWTEEKQSFHLIPEGVSTFPQFPRRK